MFKGDYWFSADSTVSCNSRFVVGFIWWMFAGLLYCMLCFFGGASLDTS